jgi:hypothetical protein
MPGSVSFIISTILFLKSCSSVTSIVFRLNAASPLLTIGLPRISAMFFIATINAAKKTTPLHNSVNHSIVIFLHVFHSFPNLSGFKKERVIVFDAGIYQSHHRFSIGLLLYIALGLTGGRW